MATMPTLSAGDSITWTYVVRNTGNLVLNVISVTDDQGVDVSCPLPNLGPGASMTCSGSGIAQVGQYRNLGTARGFASGVGFVTDDDPSHYFGSESVEVAKECASNNGDGTYTYDVTVTNSGTAALDSCVLDDQMAVCGPLSQTELQPGQTATAQCTGTENMNMVKVTCNIAGTVDPQTGQPKMVMDETMAACVDVDKRISCDGGNTFVDVGYNDSSAESCTGWNSTDPNDPNDSGREIVFGYWVRTGGAMTQCVLTDSNPAIPPAPPIGSLPAKFDGEVFRTPVLTCDEVEPGEPDTATLTCIPVPDEPGDPPPPPVTDTDAADLECRDAAVDVVSARRTTGRSGATFVDVGYNDAIAESARRTTGTAATPTR